jgi:hypothetical protein
MYVPLLILVPASLILKPLETKSTEAVVAYSLSAELIFGLKP